MHVIIPAAGMGTRLGSLGSEQPKSLLEVAGRPIIMHGLDALVARGARRVTIVVGYRAARLEAAIGASHRGVPIDYVRAPEFATTEHGYSLYLSRDAWARERDTVWLVDADEVFDPRLLDLLDSDPRPDVVLVDRDMDTSRPEELVLGRGGTVTALTRGRIQDHADSVGGFVGLNRFSSVFVAAMYRSMERLFATEGRSFKYERVFDRMVRDRVVSLGYRDVGGVPWVNVNGPADLERAERVARAVSS